MIDFENNLVVVFLTNSINTPIMEPTCLENANLFAGRCYTSSTLGFVPQILYMGIGNTADPEAALDSLVRDMANEKQKLAERAAVTNGGPLDDDHPIMKALKAIQALVPD